MAGAFDAKVDISTAEATANLRNLRKEVQLNAASFKEFDTILKAGNGNLKETADSLTKLVAAQRAAASGSRELAQERIANARAAGLEAQNTQKAAESAAREANQMAQTARAKAQETAASQRGIQIEEQRAAAQDRSSQAAARAAQSQAQLGDSLSNSRYLMYDVGATYGVIAAGLMAIPAATTAVAAAYQKDFAQVLRVTEDLKNGGAELKNGLKDLATEMPIAFGDLTRITQLGAQMGVANGELKAFTETTAKFVAVTGISADTAATMFGRMETSFTKDVAQYPDFFERVGASIAKVGAETVATDPEIASMLAQIGSLGASAGMTAAETTGLAAALSSVRVQPELARGTLTRLFGDLNRLVAEGGPELLTYGKLLGVNAEQAAKLWKTDPSKFFTGVVKGLHEVQQKNGNLTGTLDDLGIKASRDVSALTKLAVGYDVLDTSMKSAQKGFTDGTALDEMSKPVFETLTAKLEMLSNSWKNLADTIGSNGLGPIAVVVDILKEMVTATDSLIRQHPQLGALLGILMGFAALSAVFIGLKAAQAFVIAGFIGFQQASAKGIGASMSMSGVLRQGAQTMLMMKGATDAQSQSLLAQAGAWKALQVATTTSSARLAATATVSNNLDTTMTRSVSSTNGAAAGLRGFGSAALGLVGGVPGLITLIGIGLVGAFIDLATQADRAADSIQKAAASSADAGLREMLAKLQEGTKGLYGEQAAGSTEDQLQRIGISFEDLSAKLVQGQPGLDAFNKQLDELAKERGFANVDAINEFMDSNGLNVDDKARDILYVRDAVNKLGGSFIKGVDDGKQLDSAMSTVKGAIADTGDAADDASTQVDDLADAVKKLNDAVFSTIDAEAAMQSALGSLGESLQKSGSFNTTDAGGRENLRNFQESLGKAQEYYFQLMQEGTLSAEQAATGYSQFVQGLIDQVRTLGGDTSAVEQLATTTKSAFASVLGADPVSVPVTTDEASATAAGAKAVATVQSVADTVKAYVGVDANTADAQVQLNVLATDLAKITGLPYAVVMDALTNPASEKANQIYALLTSITNGTYVAPVNADTSAAIANVQNFLAYARTELSHLQTELNGGVGYGDGEGSLGTEQKAQYAALGAPAQVAAPVASAPVPVAAPAMQMPAIATPNFDGLNNGYKDAADAAKKAGDAGKKAGKDMADGIDDATRAAEDYAQRLMTGLKSAFDQQNGMAAAADAYHTQLNKISKKREDELKQLSDLRLKQRELNDERNKDLVDANKAKIEAGISKKYGETDRAIDYENQAKTALDNADAKKKDIDATKKQGDELQAGIGNLKGYSQAAIDNRNDLRDLESKMLDMIGAYANTGASQQDVKRYAEQLTGQFKKDVTQLGINKGAVEGVRGKMQAYVDTVSRVPRTKPTTVTADTGGANGAINGVKNNLASIPRNTHATVTVDKTTRNWYTGSVEPTGNKTANGQPTYRVIRPDGTRTNNILFNRGGQVQGFASGGLIPGTPPANPREDNLMAKVDGKRMIKVRSREFIQPQEAVDYYGTDFMNAIRTLSLPKFNAGGHTGGYASSGGGSGQAAMGGIPAELIQAINRLADRDLKLFTSDEIIATSAKRGDRILASKGVR